MVCTVQSTRRTGRVVNWVYNTKDGGGIPPISTWVVPVPDFLCQKQGNPVWRSLLLDFVLDILDPIACGLSQLTRNLGEDAYGVYGEPRKKTATGRCHPSKMFESTAMS